MGTKKHKKHKTEKKERYDDKQGGAEKPPALKIILKVGSSSTPEHSDSPGPSLNVNYSVAPPPADEESRQSVASLHGEDKHHKKAKKKKKKKEKEKEKDRDKHEKKHKHHHKERRKRPRDESSQDDVSIGEESVPEPPQAKKMLVEATKSDPDVPLREPRSCVLRRQQERSPLQKLLEFLLKGLEKKDPQQFFAWPVTDNIAPGYSQIIQQPMDFSTMKQKIDDNQYNTMSEYVEDFKLMCNNAMVYNHQDTIYYKAAKKLLHVGLKTVSTEKLKPLQNVLTYMSELSKEELGFEVYREVAAVKVEAEICEDETVEIRKELKKKPKSPKPLGKFEANRDVMTPEEILNQARKAAQGAADRLTLKRPNSKIGFLRQNKDGTTSLAILCSGDGVTPGTNERPISLGALTGKLTHGTGQLQGFREDRRNLAKAVKPLYYGPFGSYAPSYDSTFANLTKEESDLVYATYGDETAVQYAESILDFAKSCDYTLQMVDNLLDIMTSGEHSKTMRVLEERRKLREEEEKIKQLLEGKDGEKQQIPDSKIDFDSLKTLTDVGIDMKFLESVEQQYRTEEAQRNAEEAMQTKLDQTSELLEKLQKVQRDRLSMTPPAHLAHVAQPSDTEVQLAEKITESLKDMAKKVNPEDVAPTPVIRKALGIGVEPLSPGELSTQDQQEPMEVDVEGTSSQAEDVPDLESELREFLENDPTLGNSPLQDDKTIEEILSES